MEIEMNRREPLVRKMTLADLDDLYALLSDSEVMRYIESPFSKEQTVSAHIARKYGFVFSGKRDGAEYIILSF